MIPHALLFCGIDTAGKRNAAVTFALACNCLSRCPETRRMTVAATSPEIQASRMSIPAAAASAAGKILSDNHPDIFNISPTGAMIRIAQIRGLGEALSMKPYEARRRFVIISDAQTLNPEAGNAILKLLEEPLSERSLSCSPPRHPIFCRPLHPAANGSIFVRSPAENCNGGW
jgi:DNA polymerase-3 subunit delta'